MQADANERYVEVKVLKLNGLWPWIVICNPAVLVLSYAHATTSALFTAGVVLMYIKVTHDRANQTIDFLGTMMNVKATVVRTAAAERVTGITSRIMEELKKRAPPGTDLLSYQADPSFIEDHTFIH